MSCRRYEPNDQPHQSAAARDSSVVVEIRLKDADDPAAALRGRAVNAEPVPFDPG